MKGQCKLDIDSAEAVCHHQLPLQKRGSAAKAPSSHALQLIVPPPISDQGLPAVLFSQFL